jgi:hypothetical protein
VNPYAHATAFGITFLIRPRGNDAPLRYPRTASSADDPTESVRIVKFENGLYEAKQEAQYGNLAIFRSGRRFLEYSQRIKTNGHWPIVRPTKGTVPQSGDVSEQMPQSGKVLGLLK